MENLFDIKGKVVVMTGACGVLGATIVKYFAAQGAKVALLDLDRASEKGEGIVAEIKAEGGEACFLPTNVLDKETLEANCKEIVAKFGGIDILLNAAGGNMAAATVPPEKTIFDLDVEAVRKVVDLNLFGTVLPTMVSRRLWWRRRKVRSSTSAARLHSGLSHVWPVMVWPRPLWPTGPSIWPASLR